MNDNVYVVMELNDFKAIKQIIDKIDPMVYSKDYKESVIYLKIAYNILRFLKDQDQQKFMIKLSNIFNLFNKYYMCLANDYIGIKQLYDIFNSFKNRIDDLSNINIDENDFKRDITKVLDIKEYRKQLKEINKNCVLDDDIKNELFPTYFDKVKFSLLNMFYQTGVSMPTSMTSIFTLLKLLSKILCDSIELLTNGMLEQLFLFLNVDAKYYKKQYQLTTLVYFIKLMCKLNLRNLNLLLKNVNKQPKKYNNTNLDKIIEKRIENQTNTEHEIKINNYFNTFTNTVQSQVQDEDDKNSEKKKVKNISQHTSSFIYIFRNVRAYILENVTSFVSQMEISPEGQALMLLSLISITKSVKVNGWSTIGKYYDYKVDKLLGQSKKGRAPNPPSISISMNRRMLLTNCGILAYAYRKELTKGLKDLLETEIEDDEDDEEIPIAFGGNKRIIKGGDDYSDLIEILKKDEAKLKSYNYDLINKIQAIIKNKELKFIK
jgi:hypothetical protein